MAVNTQKYIIQNIERIASYNLETGACSFVVEDLQEAQMTNEEELVYVEGKNGTKIGTGDGTKSSKFTATNGIVVEGLLAAQVGDTITSTTQVVPDYMDFITATSATAAVTKFVAQGTLGSEIQFIYKKALDGTMGVKYAIGATASATTFTYDPATKAITLPTGAFATGEELIAVYDIQVDNVKKIVNAENKYSSTEKVVFDIWAKDICTNKSYYGKIIYPKGKIVGNFDLSFGKEATAHALEVEAMSGGCGAGMTKTLWEMYIFDGDDAT